MGVLSKALEIVQFPEELGPLYRMYKESKRVRSLVSGDADTQFCYSMLNRVSRSFAIVIQMLPECLRDAICVFYLTLRALDTVEDDMALPNERKLPLLHTFHDKLKDESFHVEGCGDKDYKELLEQYPKVTRVYLRLEPACQVVIKDICHRMGVGMAEFIEKEVITVDDYDMYCHYVAGLVGLGLSHLFAATGCEGKKFRSQMDDLANHMGLFLQKTNIIRDYLEDIVEEPAPRMFWPREIWGRYAGELADFKEPKNRGDAVKCLNHMVTDAMRHAPKALEYMSQVEDPQVFAFCAIPQVMAIATLSLCYDNGKVFEGVVKMRRGQTAVVFEELAKPGALYQQFYKWGLDLQHKGVRTLAEGDPTAEQLMTNLNSVLETSSAGVEKHEVALVPANNKSLKIFMVWLSLLYTIYAFNVSYFRDILGIQTRESAELVDSMQPTFAMVMLGLNFVSLFVA